MEYKFTDTHSHLYDTAFDEDRAEVMERALEAGVGRIALPAIDSSSHEALLDMARRYPGRCYPLMGLHPTSVNDNTHWRRELELVEALLKGGADGIEFYGVGEVGMDLYWSRDYEREQEEAFRRQVELSLELSLPLVIHTREAWPQMRAILASYRGAGLRGVMHAFSGTLEDYRFLQECGRFLFGIGGPVTYKKSALAEILPGMDIGHLVLETDSPYLPPVPFRGKRNESSYIGHIALKVAEIKGVTLEVLSGATERNAAAMFGF